MKNLKLISVLSLLLICVACMTIPPPRAHVRYSAPEPCMVPVQALRFQTEIVAVTINTTYNAKDINGARQYSEPEIIAELNAQSKADGDFNTIEQQNGQQQNFSYVFTVNNDGAGHFTGSLYMTAWGGFRHTFNTAYAYNDPNQMLRDLTDQSYTFMHTGWQDIRSTCN